MLMKYSRMETFEESIEEHEKIVDAVLIKDTECAVEALASNII